MNRRNFIKTLGVASVAALAPTFSISAQNEAKKLNVVVFWEESFPIVDGLNISKDSLQTALNSHHPIFADSSELIAKLNKDTDLFINPYGAAFPKAAWKIILKYLQDGGNFLNLGGAPLAVPVVKNAGGWRQEIRQVNFHKRLGILQAFEIENESKNFRSNIEELKEFSVNTKIEKTFALYPRLTTQIEFAEEAGGDGAREGKMAALVQGIDAENRAINAPVVMFDRLQGEFAGGRWIFAAFTGTIETKTIKTLAETAGFGAMDFSISTNLACYRSGEKPILKIRFTCPKAGKNPFVLNNGLLNYYNDAGEKAGEIKMPVISFNHFLNESKNEVPLSNAAKSGFYQVQFTTDLSTENGVKADFVLKTGFWVFDEKLMQAGAKLAADKHFLYRNNEPFPVVGTTYMASDVARRFLLEPNPAVWDKDFADMKAAGVNMIRTGIWTAWKLYFDEKGEVKQEILRAFEAFLLTAKKYDIPVIFTFFAFLPEMFGGQNAYLDPQAINGQKRFLQAFAHCAKLSPDTVWDLINEPSFNNPKNLWSCRPNYDEFEKAAWKDWLKKHFREPDETRLTEILQEKWRLSAEENPFELPRMDDFDSVNIQTARRPLKTLEFRLFAQRVFENWAREMRETLQTAGNTAQFVTVGQDEAGTGDSPNPQFHADSLDFTCLHNWWANDDLLWDSIVTKSPLKPNMVQESGVMFYEKIDGRFWRTEETVGNLLERKMALSLGANGCGFIEWIWNTNPFMNIDNEAGIGFLRVDGSAKPELKNFIKIAKFANANRKLFNGKIDEKILLLLPHSQMFTPRNMIGEATKKAVRALHYHCRHTCRAVGEYNLQAILNEPQAPALIVVPAPRTLTETTWKQLLSLAERGSVVAVSGYFADDEHFMPQPRFKELGSESVYPPAPVAQVERIEIEGQPFSVRFAGEKIQRLEKADFPQEYIWNARHGAGEFLWSRLPLENGESLEPVAAFYRFALKKAKLTPFFKLDYENEGLLIRPTEFKDAILYASINETGRDELVKLTHLATNTKFEIYLPKGQTGLMFIDKKDGKILGRIQ